MTTVISLTEVPIITPSPPANTSLANVIIPKVLCWIMTCPKNHQTKAKAVKQTWGKRCDKILFMSSRRDDDIGTIVLRVNEGRNYLWTKTKKAFMYIHDTFLNDYDWFLKADDDTYVIMENLKHLLESHNPNTPIYFGSRFKGRRSFMSGGAGYVLSREALKRFVRRALPNRRLCYRGHKGHEDVEIGKCLQNVQVVFGDSRDEYNKTRFFPNTPEDRILPGSRSTWYSRYMYYPGEDGFGGLSNRPISFHYINYKRMYALEYLIYKVRFE